MSPEFYLWLTNVAWLMTWIITVVVGNWKAERRYYQGKIEGMDEILGTIEETYQALEKEGNPS